ncbi:MAG TPA: hypothetical protein PLL54_11665 [Dermatophilaceae bacterium]|jgi:hypothetical protein|nr:hypothetical protein [Dermatophilaceae bacterium]
MRTTLELDDQVLAAARALARARGTSLGEAVSELARRGLHAQRPTVDVSYSPFPIMIGDADTIVTDELVTSLRDG